MSLLGHGWFSYSFGSGCLRQCPDTDDLPQWHLIPDGALEVG